MLGRAAVVIPLLSALACASGPPPAFESPRALGAHWALLRPEIRLSGTMLASEDQDWAKRIAEEFKTALTARGFSVRLADGTLEGEALRRQLLEVLNRARGGGGARLRTGTELGLGPALQPWREEGVTNLALVTLGGMARTDERVPLPPDAVLRAPEDSPDYDVPRAGSASHGGVSLELMVTDVRTGLVQLHRRIAHPAEGRAQIERALADIVRETLRGLEREALVP